MSAKLSLGARLYSGETSVDFVGRRRTWYILSGVILLVAIAAVGIRGLNLGVEFTGGAVFTVPQSSCTVEDARSATQSVMGGEPIVTQTGQDIIRVQTEPLSQEENLAVTAALGQACGINSTDVTVQSVGPTWGAEITGKALQALVVFLILVVVFLSIYFEWRMAVAALVALAHDVVITVGIYALTGLEITPATVIGVLTILGYSLYDTVVVFDKVKENTRGITGQSVQTYSEAANLAVNQTVVRSINTSVVALLPVVAIFIVGAGLLGAGTLLDLAVALFIGMAAGTYSSIFIATPFLAQLKEHQPEMKAVESRVAARRSSAAKRGGDAAESGTVKTATTTQLAPGERQQPKRRPRSKRGRA